MITIVLVGDTRARYTVLLALAITVSYYVNLLLQLSLKVVRNSRVFPVLPLTRKLAPEKLHLKASLENIFPAFCHTRPVIAKTYVLGKSTDS